MKCRLNLLLPWMRCFALSHRISRIRWFKVMWHQRVLFIIFPVLLLLSGCTTYVENVVSEDYEPIFQETADMVEQAPTGGIYSDNGQGFFPSTRRNRQVGDIISVTMLETFSATKSSSAASSKTDAFDVILPTGLPNALTGGFVPGDLTSGTAQNFSGSGTASQSNSLTGSVSVTVTRVYANGNLEIGGQKN